MGRTSVNLTGKRFGQLRVLRFDHIENGRMFWLCKCRCGNTTVVSGSNLRTLKTQSCGCIPKGRKGDPFSMPDLRISSETLHSLDISRGDPYQNLANAIVALAVDDYKYALENNDKERENEVKSFFKSDWYKTLTTIKPEKIITSISKEVNTPQTHMS